MGRRPVGVALAAVTAAVALLAGCGGSSPHKSGSGVTTTSESDQALAYARCMRSHGVPDFPDPDAQGDFPEFRPQESKQVAVAADDACKHLRSSGGTATPQQRQQKLEFGVKVAECLRKHGYPDMPDPTGLGANQLPPDVNANSPQFQTTENACEAQARKALGLP